MNRLTEEGIRYISKYVAIVEISDPTDVTTRVEKYGDVYSNGGIYVSCPELGFEGDNLIYCRYALSTPYYKVKDGDRVWIEPTIGQTERWIYSGFVDCGRESVDPTAETDTQGIIENEDGFFIFKMGDDFEIKIDTTTKILDVVIDSGTSLNIDAVHKTGSLVIGGCEITLDDTAKTFLLTQGTTKIEGTDTSIKFNGTAAEVLA